MFTNEFSVFFFTLALSILGMAILSDSGKYLIACFPISIDPLKPQNSGNRYPQGRDKQYYAKTNNFRTCHESRN